MSVTACLMKGYPWQIRKDHITDVVSRVKNGAPKNLPNHSSSKQRGDTKHPSIEEHGTTHLMTGQVTCRRHSKVLCLLYLVGKDVAVHHRESARRPQEPDQQGEIHPTSAGQCGTINHPNTGITTVVNRNESKQSKISPSVGCCVASRHPHDAASECVKKSPFSNTGRNRE